MRVVSDRRSTQPSAARPREAGVRFEEAVKRRPVGGLALALGLALAGCGAEVELSVDVRTDLAPGRDADAVRVLVIAADGAQHGPTRRSLDPGEAWGRGARAADFAGLPTGATRVEVTLEQGGVSVLTRRVELTLEGDRALTVVLDRACMDARCEGATSECARGLCVSPACGGGDEAACGALACSADDDCALAGCALAHCQEALCVCDSDTPVADAAPLDTGLEEDAGGCECEGTGSTEETRPCGACGEGVERRTRYCDGCAYGAFTEWGACETDAECAPGEIGAESMACGNCMSGTQRRERACDAATCRFGAFGAFGACTGGGLCAPGATRAGCDPCGHEVCTASCTWGACTPSPGSECLRIRPGTTGPAGNNFRCCGTGRWQFCLASCDWSTACEACGGNCSCP